MPALAVSAELKKRGAEVLFVGHTPADRRLVEAAGFPFEAIPAGKLRRYFSIRTLFEPLGVFRGYRRSLRIIKRFRPDVLFAKGGFVALPVMRAAKRRGIPIVLHESDLVPGLANRTGGKWAAVTAVSFPPERMQWQPAGRVVQTGNPLRSEILKGKAERARKTFGLSASLPVVLVLGGSQGSRTINETLAAALPELLPEAQVIHQVGERAGEAVGRYVAAAPAEYRKRYHVRAFLGDELFDCYAATDLVVTRAGAGGLAEVAAVGKPAVVIPLASAAGGHQAANAAVFKDADAAVVVPEGRLDGAELARTVKRLLHDPTRRARLGRAARSLAHLDAAAKVAELVWETGKQGENKERDA